MWRSRVRQEGLPFPAGLDGPVLCAAGDEAELGEMGGERVSMSV